jgi:hypothetical protein
VNFLVRLLALLLGVPFVLGSLAQVLRLGWKWPRSLAFARLAVCAMTAFMVVAILIGNWPLLVCDGIVGAFWAARVSHLTGGESQ